MYGNFKLLNPSNNLLRTCIFISKVFFVMVFTLLVAIQVTTACECKYYKAGGCALIKAAPRGEACKCVHEGFWTCKGKVIACPDQNHPLCELPTTSKKSCEFARGNCGGY